MHVGSVLLTGSAELDDLAPLGDGVVPVSLFGSRLHSHGVLRAGAEEPVAPNSHGQRHRFGHQLSGDVLEVGQSRQAGHTETRASHISEAYSADVDSVWLQPAGWRSSLTGPGSLEVK